MKTFEEYTAELDTALDFAVKKARKLEDHVEHVPIKLRESMMRSLKAMIHILEGGGRMEHLQK